MKKEYLHVEDDKSLSVKGDPYKGKDINYSFKENDIIVIPNNKTVKVSTYIISEELVNAVNAAIITGRPLLLKGEPGCGKTKLAKAVAYHFFKDRLDEFYFEWHVKSKSKAKDGAYTFDHVSRLRDATISDKNPSAQNRVSDPTSYIELGPMGLAFKAKAPDGHLPILLIDEIDKGDIDFPNDLLLELDEMRFKINELDQQGQVQNKRDPFITADPEKRPLVFITSNDERELPPAFLRRCLYFKIPSFPKDLLIKIVNAKLNGFYEDIPVEKEPYTELTDTDIDLIVTKFRELKKQSNVSAKSPSTSELLDWIQLIFYVFNKKDNQLLIKDLIEQTDLQKLALKLM